MATVAVDRPAGACVRCRRIKTKCTYQDSQTKCRSCLRGGYDCLFLTRAERTAEKRRRIRQSSSYRETGSDDSQPPPEDTTPADQPPPPPTQSFADHAQRDLTELLNQCQDLLRKFLWPFSPFHWPTFQKKLADRTVEPSLYYAVIASAIRGSRKLTTRFSSPTAASDFFARKSRQRILENLDHPSLADVQALLLTVLIDWGSSRGTRAFMYLGMAARMALTFLPEADHRVAKDFLAAETARRTIWMVFMVEQFLSSGNGRIPAIRARELPISLPCSEMDYLFGTPSVAPMFDGGAPPRRSAQDPVGPVGEFGSMIQISSIWNLVATWRFKCSPEDPVEPQLRQLEGALSEWTASLTAQYQDKPGHLDLHVSLGTGFAFGFAHSVYHCALVFLHRERLYAYSQGGDSPASGNKIRDKAIETIFSSAERIIEIINTLEAMGTEDTVVIFPIFMLYACFTASSAIAYISIRQWTNARQSSFKIVRESLRILRTMKSTWPLVGEWHAQLSSMVKVLQDRAMGIGNTALQDLSFERLPYGHVRAQTPTTPIETPSNSMASTAVDGGVSDDIRDGSGPPNYFAELSPGFRGDLDRFLDTQDDLSIFLG
ncbi:hypothetical protein GQ53DRAFT_883062 [Thozetella sp. PMI_491]|nr:hypothetical protein GQ53DRAFT_883062 [Thozetella sp. PMI_491]